MILVTCHYHHLSTVFLLSDNSGAEVQFAFVVCLFIVVLFIYCCVVYNFCCLLCELLFGYDDEDGCGVHVQGACGKHC